MVQSAFEVASMESLRIKARVQAGGRIEVVAPGLSEGDAVDVVVTPESSNGMRQSMLDLIGTLPAGPRSAASWDELDRALREERDAWDH
jgi:hypothetical protein